MRIAVCPGTYDPITFGHLDIIMRARSLFDEIVVAIARNSAKTPLLTLDERVQLCTQAVDGMDRVRVEVVPGLLAQFCRDLRVGVIVKGLRGGADFDSEVPMALMNRKMAGAETLFLPGDGSLAHIASSLVKDIARYGGPIDQYTTPAAAQAVHAAFARANQEGEG